MLLRKKNVGNSKLKILQQGQKGASWCPYEKKMALKNLGAFENLICTSLIEILSSSSVPRGFCLN